MKYPTTIKKYRIVDYSQLEDAALLQEAAKFIKKEVIVVNSKVDHKYLMKTFSNAINLYNIFEELFKRHPQMKDSIDFESELEEIIKKNSINASKN